MRLSKTLIQKEIDRQKRRASNTKAQIAIGEKEVKSKDFSKEDISVKKDAIRDLNTVMGDGEKVIKELEADLKKL